MNINLFIEITYVTNIYLAINQRKNDYQDMPMDKFTFLIIFQEKLNKNRD